MSYFGCQIGPFIFISVTLVIAPAGCIVHHGGHLSEVGQEAALPKCKRLTTGHAGENAVHQAYRRLSRRSKSTNLGPCRGGGGEAPTKSPIQCQELARLHCRGYYRSRVGQRMQHRTRAVVTKEGSKTDEGTGFEDRQTDRHACATKRWVQG
jgi:hypothetical protein